MAYNPISGAAIQYSKSNGQIADGYWLKFYIANTTTPLSMATDSTASTTLVKCKLNDKGYPITNPLDNESAFIPYMNQPYRFVLYPTEADADGNLTENADINIPSVDSLAGASVVVSSVASIADLPPVVIGNKISVTGYQPGSINGGGPMVGRVGRHDGVIYFDPDRVAEIGTAAYYVDSGVDADCWVRTDKKLTVEKAGASPSAPDNTVFYDGLIAAALDGDSVTFESSETYIGNFISETKSLNIDLNGATLVNVSNTESVIQIGSLTVDEYSVTEVTLNHGDTQFTVVGASGLFSVGDVGYLWDQAVRPTGGNVNFESIKIADIAGDVITVEGFLASYKGAAGIKFYHSSSQLKNPSIKNGFIQPTSSHTGLGVAILNCESVNVSNIGTQNTTGDAVAVRYCYDVTIDDIRPKSPANVGSGQGYGVALFGVSHYSVNNIRGSGCRHVFDQDSAYFGDINDAEDMDDQSAPFDLAHNGFAGYFNASNLRAKITQRMVLMSSGGYGGATSADAVNHPFRNINISNVDATVDPSISPDTNIVPGVYFENNTHNVTVNGVNIEYLSATALTVAAQSTAVRVDGIATGKFSVENLSVNKIGRFFFSNGDRNGYTPDGCIATFDKLKAAAINVPFFAQGPWGVSIDNVQIDGVPFGDRILYLEASGGEAYAAYVGNNIHYDFSTLKTILETTGTTMRGSLPVVATATGTGLPVVTNDSLTNADIQNRSALIRLTSNVGAGTTVMNATDALPMPQVNGTEIYLSQPNAGRESVQFPAGNNIWTGFTIAAEETVRLVSYSGKWALAGRYAAV